MTQRQCDICAVSFTLHNGRQLTCDVCRRDPETMRARTRARVRRQKDKDPQAYRQRRRDYRAKYSGKIKAYQKDWYEQNRAHVSAYGRQYAADNRDKRQAWMDANRAEVRQWAQRRRTRLKDNGVYVVTERDLTRTLNAHGCACAYCGIGLTASTLTWDHITPISRGGTHSIGNLAPACKPCNSAKRDRPAVEWRAYLLKVAV